MPIVFIIWLLLSWLIADQVLLTRNQTLVQAESQEVEQQARKLSESIKRVIKQQHGIPQLVARDQRVVQSLQHFEARKIPTASPAEYRQQWSEDTALSETNAYLQEVASLLGSQVVYVISTAGDCIASSNVRQPNSFVGTNYSERTYFKMAMAGELETQYAMGKVSNIPGLFFSSPVYAGTQRIGVVVSKLNLDNIAHFIGPSDVFISDRYGVIILASDKKLEMQALPDASISQLPLEKQLARYKHSHFNSLHIAQWDDFNFSALRYFTHERQPFVLSQSYGVEPDVNVHVLQHLPQLSHVVDDKLELFSLLALIGAILTGGVAWRLYINRNNRRNEQVLRDSEAHFRNMADTAPALIWISDVGNQGMWYNKSWLVYTGRSLDQELGMGWMADIHPDDLPRCKAFISLNADAPLHQRYEVEYRLRRADGSYGWVADTATPYVDLAGKFQGYIGYCWDIDQRKNTEEQIRHLAFYDSLTRLPNRRLLSERLTHAITVSKRDQRYGAAIFLDLDNFKPLNDTYGHGVGDMLLIEVAHRISGCMREVDTVARFGGDEFILVLNGLDANRAIAMAEAGNIADKIRLTLAEPYHLVFQQDDVPRHIEHHCTSSIGVMLFLGASVKQKDILRCADIAMYRAKEGGRNMLVFYE